MTSKEKLNLLVKCILYRKEDDIPEEEMPIYKEILEDLEVLEILKKHGSLKETNLVLLSYPSQRTYYMEYEFAERDKDYQKVKEWLDND